MKKLTPFLILALALLIAVPVQAQQKMKFEDYQKELEQWNERERIANEAIEDCQGQKDELTGQLQGRRDEIAAAWQEVYDLLGITQADVDDFQRRLDDFGSRLDAYGRMSPEQMYQESAKLDSLKMELDQLAMEPAANLTRFHDRIQRYYRDIENYRGRMAGPRNPLYTVVRGDHLWGIAKKPQHFGDGLAWYRIYSVNREKINNPDLIYPNQQFTIPMETPQGAYLVKRGDTWRSISQQVYGDPNRAQELKNANQSIMMENGWLYPNMILQVPGR